MNKALTTIYHHKDAICANCRFWQGREYTKSTGPEEQKGKCIKAKSFHGQMYSPCGLWTTADFFCPGFIHMDSPYWDVAPNVITLL